MTLILVMRRSPDGVGPESRRLSSGDLSIGRGPANDWVLADPDRVLSKRHCVVTALGSAWEVTDLSANGTFVNDEAGRLDPQRPRQLAHGDRVIIGSYEIQGLLENEDRILPSHVPASSPSLTGERLTSDPFPPFDRDPFGILLPEDQRPITFEVTTPDTASAIAEGFRPPRTSLELLPVDWDAEISAASPSSAGAPYPPAAPQMPIPATIEAAPQPAPTPVELTPRPALPQADAEGAFAAFAAGAGVTGYVPADPLALLQSLGAAFRSVVSGLRQVMIARAAIKGEFRIEQTMIQAAGNNPLKFSADDDDALAGLLGLGRRGGMTPARAIGDAMRDMRLHELAMASAMQRAARDMLASLSPRQVEEKTERGLLDALPERRRARLWETYEALHRVTEQALAEDFDSVFGKAFVRAYEQAMRDAAASMAD
jgi:type VI secretion system protein ImpI/type VI secretion system protein